MTTSQTALAKALADHLGIRGTRGGWLHKGQKPVCQGWAAFWAMALQRGWIVPHATGTRLSSRTHCNGYRIDWRAV
jgi:hypothetical protein